MTQGDFIGWTNKQIEDHGFAVISVSPNLGSESTTQFSYTVGFTEKFDHPEILIVGLRPVTAHALLWNLYERIEAGESFEPSQRYEEVIVDYPVEFRAIPHPHRPLNVAAMYYGDIEALQMVYPDEKGIFPGEDGYSELLSTVQRLATGNWD